VPPKGKLLAITSSRRCGSARAHTDRRGGAGSSSATIEIYGSDVPACLSATLRIVIRIDADFFEVK